MLRKFGKNRIKAAAAAGLALMVCLSMMGSVSAAEDQTLKSKAAASGQTGIRYVAFGDSLTAGFEPQMADDPKLKPYGFVDRMYEQALYRGRAVLSNYGILGLTTEGLKNYLDAVKAGRTFKLAELQTNIPDPRVSLIEGSAAKAKEDVSQATLITITIGGNDFSGLLDRMKDIKPEESEALVDGMLTDYNTNVASALENIFSLNPGVTVVLADQYQPMPKFWDKQTYDKLIEVMKLYTSNTENLAKTMTDQGYSVKVAHVAKRFVDKEGELTHMNMMEKDVHPNQKGYETMAMAFTETIWGEYLQPKSKDASVPVSIIVAGKELAAPNRSVVRNNRTFVPIKDIADAIGAKSKWDSKTSTATITYGDQALVLSVGSKTAKVNNQTVAVDAPAFMLQVGKERKIYAPLHILTDGLGFHVENSMQSKTVFINK